MPMLLISVLSVHARMVMKDSVVTWKQTSVPQIHVNMERIVTMDSLIIHVFVQLDIQVKIVLDCFLLMHPQDLFSVDRAVY